MDAQRIQAPDARVTEYFAKAELESIAKTIVVPTNDDDVRRYLRSLGEQVELSNEDRADRRARLRTLLAKKKSEGIDIASLPLEIETEDGGLSDSSLDGEEIDGGPALKNAREQIAGFSASRTAARLEHDRKVWAGYESDKPAYTSRQLQLRRAEAKRQQTTELLGTQSGFARAVGSLASRGSLVIAGDWSGALCVLDMRNDMSVIAKTETPGDQSNQTAGSAGQVCVAWANFIASGGSDGTISLYDLIDENRLQRVSQLSGHAGRVTEVAFHPLNNSLVSVSHDETWRLWDLSAQSCVLSQPSPPGSGHINTLALHDDGALALVAGDDAVGRVWDLRSGEYAADLIGHAGPVRTAVWRNMQAVTGGADNQFLVWDLRNTARPATFIPAHTNVITGAQINNNTMASSSLDGTVRLWDCDSWQLLRTLQSPARVLAIASLETGWVSGRFDRCVDWYTEPSGPE